MVRKLTMPPGGPSTDQIEQIGSVLDQGELAILPTDTIYGFHAAALDPDAVDSIRSIKGRRDDKPIVVLCSGFEQIRHLGGRPAPEAEEFLRGTWPAPLTAILPLVEPIPPSSGEATLAVRVPDLAWLRNLLDRTGPLVSTSVNRSGEPPCNDLHDTAPDLLERVAVILDQGPLEGRASTVIDMTVGTPRVLRQGEFFFSQKLWKSVRKTL
ncbi:MAG: L-threonylcarbamoyladenylate synthase [Thermoanaerobaculia bacterium]